MNQPHVNYQIRESSALVIDENGISLGEIDVSRAIAIAKERGFDLVEVNPSAKPPVCKFLDYGKLLYDMGKQQKNQSKIHQPELKEIRLSFKIGENDLKIKAKKASEFLSRGDRVRVSLRMRGREMMFGDRASQILKNFIEIAGGATTDVPKRLGNQITITMGKGKENEKK